MHFEHSDLGGREIRSKTVKNVNIDIVLREDDSPLLSLDMKPKAIEVELRPPLVLYNNKLRDGKLGLKFLKYKQNPWDKCHKTLQMTVTCEKLQIAALSNLCKDIHVILRGSNIRCRPLASSNCSNSQYTTRTCLHSSKQEASNHSYSGKDDDLPSLSPEQKHALDLVLSGKSIFFTGSAGCGKSLLLQHIIRALPRRSTFITGTTGLAACHLGGTTINQFAGIGRAEGEGIVAAACRGDSGVRWRTATSLIIDEISMMDGKMFDLLDLIAKTARGNNKSFGGIQLILSGDFHQLPPVSKNPAERKFAFEADSWKHCVSCTVQLTRVFRQKDRDFVDILSAVRKGDVPPLMLRSLLHRCASSGYEEDEDGILPTKLFTHRADVDAMNARQVAALQGSTIVFTARDSGNISLLQSNCPAPSAISLKIGAQVMLNKNINSRQGLVNGARGVIEKFTPSGLPVVRFAHHNHTAVIDRECWSISLGEQVIGKRVQIPLVLAWATTVHKSQGMTLDKVEVSLERSFEPGMVYVALSRSRSLHGLRICGDIPAATLRPDHRVLQFYSRLNVPTHL